MGNKIVILVLTVLLNVSMALVQYHVFSDGSPAAKVCAAAGFVLGNLLALLGAPVIGGKPATEAQK